MKVYFAYIKFPSTGIDGFAIPIESKLNLSYNKESNCWFGLYAVTSDKKLMKLFKETRNNSFFKYSKFDIGKNTIEYEKLSSGFYRGYKLMNMKFNYKSKIFHIPLTKFEVDDLRNSCDVIDILLRKYSNLSNRNISIPITFDILKDDIKKSLDLLGFSEFLTEHCGIFAPYMRPGEKDFNMKYNEYMSKYKRIEDMLDLYSMNKSYGIGLSGGKLSNMEIDKFNAFVNIYEKFLSS